MTESTNLSSATLPAIEIADLPRNEMVEILIVHDEGTIFHPTGAYSDYSQQNAFERGANTAKCYFVPAVRAFYECLMGKFVEEIALLDLLPLLSNAEDLEAKLGGILMVWDEDVSMRRLQTLAQQLAKRSWRIKVSVKVIYATDGHTRGYEVKPLQEYVGFVTES